MKLADLLVEIDAGRIAVTFYQDYPVYISAEPHRGGYTIHEPGRLLARCVDAYELVRAANRLYPGADWELSETA